MAYQRHNFQAREVLHASEMNEIEDGIIALEKKIENTKGKFTTQPQDAVGWQEMNVTFTAAAIAGSTKALVVQNGALTYSAGSVSYQWQTKLDGSDQWVNTDLSGYNTGTLSFTASLEHNNMKVRCCATTSDGTELISDEAELTVRIPEINNSRSKNYNKVIAASDGQASFALTGGTENGDTYQWQWSVNSNDGSDNVWQDTSIDDSATTDTFIIPANKMTVGFNNRKYRCKITKNTGTTIYSEEAVLIVYGFKPANPTINYENYTTNHTVIIAAEYAGLNFKKDYTWYKRAANSVSDDDWIALSSEEFDPSMSSTATFARVKLVNVSSSMSNMQFRCKITFTPNAAISDPDHPSAYIQYSRVATLSNIPA